MKLRYKRKNNSRLTKPFVREGNVVHTKDNYFYSLDDVGGHSYLLEESVGDFISYIPDCDDEEDDDDDFNCEVWAYQKWRVFDLKTKKVKVVTLYFFFAKWHTVLNNKNFYAKVSADTDKFFD